MPRKINGRYYTDIRPRVNGVPTGQRIRRLMPKINSKKDADDEERRIQRDIQLELSGERRRSPLFAEYARGEFTRWLCGNKKRPDDDLRRLEPLLASPHFQKRLDEITPDDVERYKQDRRNTISRHGRRLAPSTINIELATLSALFRQAVASQKARANPVAGVNYLATEATGFRILEHDEEPRLMQVLGASRGYLRPLAECALLTGMRLSEILNLKVEDVDFGTDTLYVRHTKSPKDRRKVEGIPLSREARALLLSLKVRRGLFFSTDTGAKIKRVSVSVRFSYQAQRAGLHGLTFHSLRHTFGTRLAKAGRPMEEIARLMGHSSTQMTMRYVHPAEKDLRAAVEMLSERPKVLAFEDNGQRAGRAG
jgi:integrase